MKQKFHAIPVIVYVPVEHFPKSEDVYDHIMTPLNSEFPEATIFFAEDYRDGIIEIDPLETEFSGMITLDCPHSFKN